MINSPWSESRLTKHTFEYFNYTLLSHANATVKKQTGGSQTSNPDNTIYYCILISQHSDFIMPPELCIHESFSKVWTHDANKTGS